MNPTKRVTDCPTCGGTGKLDGMNCEPNGDCHPILVDCYRCEGAGQILQQY